MSAEVILFLTEICFEIETDSAGGFSSSIIVTSFNSGFILFCLKFGLDITEFLFVLPVDVNILRLDITPPSFWSVVRCSLDYRLKWVILMISSFSWESLCSKLLTFTGASLAPSCLLKTTESRRFSFPVKSNSLITIESALPWILSRLLSPWFNRSLRFLCEKLTLRLLIIKFSRLRSLLLQLGIGNFSRSPFLCSTCSCLQFFPCPYLLQI